MVKVVFHVPAEVPESHLVDAQEDPYGYLFETAINEVRSWNVALEVINEQD